MGHPSPPWLLSKSRQALSPGHPSVGRRSSKLSLAPEATMSQKNPVKLTELAKVRPCPRRLTCSAHARALSRAACAHHPTPFAVAHVLLGACCPLRRALPAKFPCAGARFCTCALPRALLLFSPGCFSSTGCCCSPRHTAPLLQSQRARAAPGRRSQLRPPPLSDRAPVVGVAARGSWDQAGRPELQMRHHGLRHVPRGSDCPSCCTPHARLDIPCRAPAALPFGCAFALVSKRPSCCRLKEDVAAK